LHGAALPPRASAEKSGHKVNKTFRMLLTCLYLLTTSNHVLAEHVTSGSFKYSYSYNYEQESAQASKVLADYTLESHFDTFSTRLELGLMHDSFDALGIGQDSIYAQRQLNPWRFENSELGFNEAYVKFEGLRYQFTVGKQVVSWGRADAIYLLNTINPFDLRETLILDDEEKFLGLWMFNSQIYFDDNELQILVIPDTNGHILPCRECQYQIRAEHFHASGIELLQGIDDDTKKTMSFQNTSVAARWSVSSEGLDYTLNIMRQLAHVPALQVVWEEGTSIGNLQRDLETKLGGSLSFASDSWAYRFEGMHFIDRTLATKHIGLYNGLSKANGLEYLLGFDYFGFDDATLMLQLHQQIITSHSSRLNVEQYREKISLTYDSNFFNQRFMLRTFIMYGVDDQDSYLQLDLRYNHFDGFYSFVRLDAFSGDTTPFLGEMSQFNPDSRLAFGVEYNF
jgi:hypothetical protein